MENEVVELAYTIEDVVLLLQQTNTYLGYILCGLLLYFGGKVVVLIYSIIQKYLFPYI